MVPQGYNVNHFLTDTDAWFVLTDAPNGLKHFQRTPIRTAMEGDFGTGNVRYIALATGPADAYKTLGQNLCKEGMYYGYNSFFWPSYVQWPRQ